jgi:SAM-dependent methyltransferase
MQADSLALRDFLCCLPEWSSVQTALDIGCGNGRDLERMGAFASVATQFVGMDSTASALEAAQLWTTGNPRYVWCRADAARPLPFPNGAFDLLFSGNLLECVPNRDALLCEMHRVLRPGGQIVCTHWDWDTQTFDGLDKARVRRIVHAFSDWQQAWMAAADGWMGRRLWGLFARSGLFTGRMETYTLTNTQFAPGWYGYEQVQAFGALAKRGLITFDDYVHFCDDLAALAARNEYFYSLTLYVYVGQTL